MENCDFFFADQINACSHSTLGGGFNQIVAKWKFYTLGKERRVTVVVVIMLHLCVMCDVKYEFPRFLPAASPLLPQNSRLAAFLILPTANHR
jgi:uncharacterized membrane protein YhfC